MPRIAKTEKMPKKGPEPVWRSRIVGYGEVSPAKLRAHPANWRDHPDAQHDAMTEILTGVGLVQNIIVNKRLSTSWPKKERNVQTLIDGHLRLTLALRDGHRRLPVTYVDLTPDEESLVLATLDPVAAMAVADETKLADLLQSVNASALLESIDGNSLNNLLESLEEGALPESGTQGDDSGASGEISNTHVITCPECGFEFQDTG